MNSQATAGNATHTARSLTKALCTVLSKHRPPEVMALLDAIFTPTEMALIEKRLHIARRLRLGESYTTIQRALGVSAATVATVSSQMNEGNLAPLLDRVEKEVARYQFLRRSSGQ